MRGGAQDADAAAGVLDHREDLRAGAGERDHLEEVGGEDGLSLGAQERGPGLRGPLRRRVDAGLAEDLLDRGRGDLDAQHESSSPWMRR